jgi:hypothetical protein
MTGCDNTSERLLRGCAMGVACTWESQWPEGSDDPFCGWFQLWTFKLQMCGHAYGWHNLVLLSWVLHVGCRSGFPGPLCNCPCQLVWMSNGDSWLGLQGFCWIWKTHLHLLGTWWAISSLGQCQYILQRGLCQERYRCFAVILILLWWSEKGWAVCQWDKCCEEFLLIFL